MTSPLPVPDYPAGRLILTDDTVLYGVVFYRHPYWGIAVPGQDYDRARQGAHTHIIPEARVGRVILATRSEIEASLRWANQRKVSVHPDAERLQAVHWPTSDEVHAYLVALGWA